MSDPSLTPEQRDFYCPHCNGRIVIPIFLPSTTGPCPHCQGTITSPEPQPIQPAPPAETAPVAPYAAPEAPAAPETPPAPAPLAPEPEPIPQAPAAVEAPPQPNPAVTPVIQSETPAPAAAAPPAPAPAAKSPKSKGILLAIIGLFLLILAGGAAVYYISEKMGTDVTAPISTGTPENKDIREANYIRVGWQKDAYQTLQKFLAGTTVEDKLPYIIRAEKLAPQMRLFYGGVDINDSDTPVDSFSLEELSEEDRRRGLFMLVYDQPPQFALKDFFRPLAPLEVQYGVENADLLLSTFARVSNFAMQPVRVQAFFKRTDDGLKLDWETFAQTKYRLFQSFTELPDIGSSETFRVLIAEDVPDKGRGLVGSRTYRIMDPANLADSTRVNVKLDSEIGRALSIINWRGSKQGVPINRTATVELEWTGEPERPVLVIKRFICWEFLGLGGKEPTPTAAAQ